VEVHKNGDGFEAEEAYFTKEMQNHHGGLILLDGHVYGSNDPGILTCMDFASGKVQWKSRETGKCSLVCVDGLLIARSEEGKVSLVSAQPDGFELLGQFEQPERSGAAAWPHPVVAGGKLLLRDQDALFCYEIGK
jgi:hypothetical protein